MQAGGLRSWGYADTRRGTPDYPQGTRRGNRPSCRGLLIRQGRPERVTMRDTSLRVTRHYAWHVTTRGTHRCVTARDTRSTGGQRRRIAPRGGLPALTVGRSGAACSSARKGHPPLPRRAQRNTGESSCTELRTHLTQSITARNDCYLPVKRTHGRLPRISRS